MQSPDAREALRSQRVALVAIALLVLACTLPTLRFGFLSWDDPEHVTRDPLVLNPGAASLREQFTTPRLGYPIPVTILSYRLDRALFGIEAQGSHATNVVLHVAVCLLAFVLARRLGLSQPAAALAVLWFGLHPVAAEPVSWISGRKDLLAAAFGLIALECSTASSKAWRSVGLGCYALGLLSKPVIAPIALLVPVLRWCSAEPRAREQAPGVMRSALTLLPYAAVLAPIAVLGVLGQRAVGATDDAAFGGLSRLHAVWYALGHHASSALLLEEPTAKYVPQPWPPSVPSAVDFAALGLLVLLALACARLRGQTQRAAVFGALFAVLTYLPSASLFFPLTRYLADSYVYLPELGVGIVFAAIFERMRGLASARLVPILTAMPWAVGVLLGASFLLSSARFSDDLSLWSHARGRFPHHARVCRQWANAVVSAKGPSAGLDAIDQCIAAFGDALFVKNRGIALAQLGRFGEARDALERARRDAPQDPVIARYLREIETLQRAQERERSERPQR